MAYVSAQDLLQELDCLTTKAGQARVQHEGDERDDCIHVGPGERQGGRWTEAGEWGGPAQSCGPTIPTPISAASHVFPGGSCSLRGLTAPSRLSCRALVPARDPSVVSGPRGGSAAAAQGA